MSDLYSNVDLNQMVDDPIYFEVTTEPLSTEISTGELHRQVSALSQRTNNLERRVNYISSNINSMRDSLTRIDDRTAKTESLLNRMVEGTLLLPKCAAREKELENIVSSLKAIADTPSECVNCATSYKVTTLESSVKSISTALQVISYGAVGSVAVLLLKAVWGLVVK